MSYIRFESASLEFRLRKKASIKDFITRGSDRFHAIENGDTIRALQDVTIDIGEGCRLGIIGHNGAGKSTFLRTAAGIYPVTSGKVEREGKVSAMFEMATGFEMEATGWENIRLRALMLGESPASIDEKIEEIAEFSELGDFLSVPVRYYSSGMYVRLAFSVSTSIEPEILLLDEAIGAGDEGFMKKAQKRMADMMDVTKILLLVTHSMAAAKSMCNRCIWLERGRIMLDGTPDEVTEAYVRSQIRGNTV